METKLLKYTFNISKYKGYKGKMMWIYFSTFKDIKYDGFIIKETKKYSMVFKVNVKLIRKLKILNLNKDKRLRNGTLENKILFFIDNSKEITEEEYLSKYPSYSYWSSSSKFYDYDEIKIEKQEQKKFQHQKLSKIYTQKGKQYENKARFR